MLTVIESQCVNVQEAMMCVNTSQVGQGQVGCGTQALGQEQETKRLEDLKKDQGQVE